MKNVLLIGVGRFGRHIAMQLSQLGHQVMAVDTNEERINNVLPFVTNAEFLRSLGIKHAGKTDVSVTSDTALRDDITILALGEYKALQKCFRI